MFYFDVVSLDMQLFLIFFMESGPNGVPPKLSSLMLSLPLLAEIKALPTLTHFFPPGIRTIDTLSDIGRLTVFLDAARLADILYPSCRFPAFVDFYFYFQLTICSDPAFLL